MGILAFAAMLPTLGSASAGGEPVATGLLVAGVFSGSLAWWLMLSSAVAALRARVAQGSLAGLSRASGFIMAGYGVLALVGAQL